MKKVYIIPSTTSVACCTEYICQTIVNSVQGGTLQYGGIEDPNEGI